MLAVADLIKYPQGCRGTSKGKTIFQGFSWQLGFCVVDLKMHVQLKKMTMDKNLQQKPPFQVPISQRPKLSAWSRNWAWTNEEFSFGSWKRFLKLTSFVSAWSDTKVDSRQSSSNKPTASELRQLAYHNSLPFIGFGFLDNFIMIVAGRCFLMSTQHC